MASVPGNRFSADEKRRNADHISFLKHRRFRWLWIALLLSVVSILGYALIDQEPRPNGGSWYGYTLGTIGLLLIVWLSLLGVRKRRMSEGSWSLKAWTSAHVYLGLSLIVVGTLHTGFQIGWNVHTLAYALMMIVILSGIWGVYAYAVLPKELSASRGDKTGGDMLETIADIDKKLESAAQPLGREGSDLVLGVLRQDVFHGGALARLTNSYPGCATAKARAGIPASGSEAEARVRELLSARAEQLDQIRRYLRIKAMLEIWLFIHIPATIALLAALLAHVISVFYYW
ncbi:hypothetical protein INR77_14975 [Erythrobacter sp. SCSIO 43205]|uniref:hypothetical protein n=1 Tax=Erythrobacter sp. SCSIO 43205 TaxID=2779361 RepID=UPI001CA89504|nr:hypothetical protein [Erythrobacter sp. SCSIO 43205]UAB78042.1 hypothetical protein INR77_14975 [Erythrobacter sp. SCSIO 43205]